MWFLLEDRRRWRQVMWPSTHWRRGGQFPSRGVRPGRWQVSHHHPRVPHSIRMPPNSPFRSPECNSSQGLEALRIKIMWTVWWTVQCIRNCPFKISKRTSAMIVKSGGGIGLGFNCQWNNMFVLQKPDIVFVSNYKLWSHLVMSVLNYSGVCSLRW